MRTSHRTQAKGSLLALSVAFFVAVAGQGAAHAAGNPLISNQASASGFPAGSQIYDSATLGSGVNPTGLLTFKLYGPTDATCSAAPLTTTTTPVNGNGYYESSRFVTNAAGTYRWTAAYGGDANNNPSITTACSASAGQVQVGRRMPLLDATRSWAAPLASATALLTGGSGPSGPTGTMTYNLYGVGNSTCAGAPVFSATRSVAGNGSYVSTTFTPTVAGAYQWVVSYSGDADNLAGSTICSDTSKAFTATVANPPVVSGSPTTVSRGGTITVTWSAIASPTSGDWVALYAAGTADGGTVTAWKYLNGTAAGSVALKFPWGAVAGNYEIRLMANNTTSRLATSSPITLVW
jgi:hypothetical protein